MSLHHALGVDTNHHQLWITRLCFFAVLLVFGYTASAATIVLDFETFPDGTSIPDITSLTTQFPDVTFTNAAVISSGISLNDFELPPHSGQNVVFDGGGPISISFASPVLSFSGYLTYYESVTLRAFDSGGDQLDSATSLFPINVSCDSVAQFWSCSPKQHAQYLTTSLKLL